MDLQPFLKILTLLYAITMVSSQGILAPVINVANGLRDTIGTALDALKNGKPLNIGLIQIPGRNGNNRPNIGNDYDSNGDSSGSREFNQENQPYNYGHHINHPHGGPPGHFPGRGPPGRYPYGRQPDQDRYSDEGPLDRYPGPDGYHNGRYPDGRPPGHHHHHHHHHHHPPHFDEFDYSPPYNRDPYDGHQNNGQPQRPKPNFGDQSNYNGINNNAGSDGRLVLNEDYDETDSRNGNNIVGYIDKFPVILLNENEIR